MFDVVLIFAAAIAVVWWGATGVVMMSGHLATLGRRHLAASVSTAVFAASLVLLGRLPVDGGAWSVGVEFLCALGVWSWVEATLYTGVLVGPAQRPLAAGVSRWTRFRHALRANLYHELAIVVAIVATAWICSQSGRPGWFAVWALGALAVMHESARLNVLLGVRNADPNHLPVHLDHFTAYFGSGPSNRFFPIAIAAQVVALLVFVVAAARAPTPAGATGQGLMAGLMVLGLLEHAALMLPVRLETLWGWAMRRPGLRQEPVGAAPTADLPRGSDTPIPSRRAPA